MFWNFFVKIKNNHQRFEIKCLLPLFHSEWLTCSSSTLLWFLFMDELANHQKILSIVWTLVIRTLTSLTSKARPICLLPWCRDICGDKRSSCEGTRVAERRRGSRRDCEFAGSRQRSRRSVASCVRQLSQLFWVVKVWKSRRRLLTLAAWFIRLSAARRKSMNESDELRARWSRWTRVCGAAYICEKKRKFEFFARWRSRSWSFRTPGRPGLWPASWDIVWNVLARWLCWTLSTGGMTIYV